ncbi:MAG: thioredoxin family protein [Endozoicomonadaceae bacterium]|nr:thioredoxin family protein [Endozoicomonadaceae bacterium]
MKKQFFFGLLMLCLFLTSRASFALSTGWMVSPQQPNVKVRLLLSDITDPVVGTVTGGLEVQLNDDWKTYWRSPGEGGIAPEATWQASDNLHHVEWLWPLPERFEFSGIHSLGYKQNIVFPMMFYINDFDQPVRLSGDFHIPSCSTTCVISDYPLALSFTPSELLPDTVSELAINEALSRVPSLMPESGINEVAAVWDNTQQILRVTAQRHDGWAKSDVIVDGVEDVVFGLPTQVLQGEQLIADIPVSSWLEDVDLSNQALAVTFVGDDYVKEVQVIAQKGEFSDDIDDIKGDSLLYLLGFALLGGLILNLMPCVLPVLGMKLASLVMASGQSQSQVRRQFLSSAAGILFSFWLLATGLLVLKAVGAQVGWGIQFQNPWFIGFMILVTTLFSANLLSCFEIQLPSSLSSRLALAGDNGLVGSFVQGMLATLLATPCSAPFLGTAVAFALVSDSLTLWMIFTSLGIGMAAPYLLLSICPGLLRHMPKPGAWMNTLRYVLGLLLLGTTGWLVSVLRSHLSIFWVLVVAMVPAFLLFYSLIRATKPVENRGLVSVVALCLSFVLVVFGNWSLEYFDKGAEPNTALNWTVFDEGQIESEVKAGHVVFVDITADWCITCQANKSGVLNRSMVIEALNAPNVVLMQGDWTKPSKLISPFLNQHNRYGVPFNIIYGPRAKEGITLPVILTRDIVMGALRKAESSQENEA